MFPAASAQMINVFSCWLFQCPNTHSTRLPPNIILTLLFSLPVLWIRYNLFLSLLPVCVRSLSWLQLPCGWPVWVGHPLKTQQHPISLKVDYGATRLHLIYFMSLCTHTQTCSPQLSLVILSLFSGTWLKSEETVAMKTKRADFAAAFLRGRMVVAGGLGKRDELQTNFCWSAWLKNLHTRTWWFVITFYCLNTLDCWALDSLNKLSVAVLLTKQNPETSL